MKIINKKEKQLTFTLEMEESLANAIRRYLNQIPILAIDEIEIKRNDSPLYDETLAHRVGLIPLKMDKSMSSKTVSKFKLNTKEDGFVYSGKLGGGKGVVYDKIPITLLNKGQELELVGTAIMGNGSEHTKFSPGLMFYRDDEDIKGDKQNISSKELRITLESFGQLPVNDLFIKSIETLKKDLASVSKKVK